MADELKVNITVRGAQRPTEAEVRIVVMLKRILYLIDGVPGEFGARIESPSGIIELDANGEWQRVRDSNSREADPNRTSDAAP